MCKREEMREKEQVRRRGGTEQCGKLLSKERETEKGSL